MGYRIVNGIDRNRYTDLSHQGLEGPFLMSSGKVLYYDRAAGLYWDRDSDFYLSSEDMAVHHQALLNKLL